MSQIFWLASYPKSGNTWFRAMVAAFRKEGAVDINDLGQDRGIASARAWFDRVMLFPSGLLTHEECERVRPQVYMADDELDREHGGAEGQAAENGFVKTHDAYTFTVDGQPMLGGRDAARGAILIVRDPRDICASLANHSSISIDEAISFMDNSDSALCAERDRQPTQLRQRLFSWSGFMASWLDQTDLPVHLIRYEDLQANAAAELRAGLAFAGVEASEEEAGLAARSCGFEELRRQELQRGFREAPLRARAGFFRSGVSGGWKAELTMQQAARIERDHLFMMQRIGYLDAKRSERGAGS